MTTAPTPPHGGGADTTSGGGTPDRNRTVNENVSTDSSVPSTGPGELRTSRRIALEKLGMWFVFAVVFAVLPTCAKFLQGLTYKNYQNPGLYELASRADLYVVCMGLAATAIGQALMRTEGKMPTALKLWSVLNIVILALVTFLASGADDRGVDQVALGQQSLVILAATLVSAGWSTYLCELESA